MRRYQEIWHKTKTSPERKVTVRCRPAKMETLIQGVLKEKSKENAPKKALGLPYYGELVVRRKIVDVPGARVGETQKMGEIVFQIPVEMIETPCVNVSKITAEQL